MRIINVVENLKVLSGIQFLHPYLTSRTVTNHICQYKDKIFIRETISTFLHDGSHSQQYSIRIWKSNSILDVWYDRLTSRNFIAALDYELFDDYVKIDYLKPNDAENSNNLSYGCISNYEHLTDYDAKEVVNSMIKYVENIARQNNKNKIVLDVHGNLRIFNKYYAENGFIVTDRKCCDNPFWKETEKMVKPLENFMDR